MDHNHYMKRALELAEQSRNFVSPNPPVGAVLVKNGKIIGEGFHRGPGTLHAEADAINNAIESVEGATLYCTLEPCCSVYEGKRQPPCTDKIIRKKIGRVIVGVNDPNPEVQGKGVNRLRSASIPVEIGILQDETEELIEAFSINQQKNRPFIHMKIAQTLDGCIASITGDSKWITDSDARNEVHSFRARYDAILTGANTVRTDNPLLTVRLHETRKNLKRIIVSQTLNLNRDSRIFDDQDENPTLIITSDKAPEKSKSAFRSLGIALLECPLNSDGQIDLSYGMKKLYQLGITSIFIEGGQKVYTSFLKADLVDRITIYSAPIICGNGLKAIDDLGIKHISQSLRFKKSRITQINNQTVFHGWRG
jgi:diaminohydroxyphosphoribosylaminopyrimidine deaminase/5-amino-6-(5-phosphoribosylamino)uracil reductase